MQIQKSPEIVTKIEAGWNWQWKCNP